MKTPLLLSLLLLPTLLPADDYEWDAVAMGGGGFVSAILAHPTEPNLLYARTDVGGAYRWEEAQQAWIPLLDWVSPEELGFLGVQSLALDPRNPDHVFLVGGTSYWNDGRTAVLRSHDRGSTWQIADVTNQWKANGNGMGRQGGEKLAVDPNNGEILYCGTRSNGLFRSTDGGALWSRVESLPDTTTPNGNGIAFVLLDPSSGKPGSATPTLYVAVSRAAENLFVSHDAGTTWSRVLDAPEGLLPQRHALAPDGSLFITYADGAGPHGDKRVGETMGKGALWRYDLRGGAWANVTPAGGKRALSGVSIAPQTPGRVVATTINTYLPQPWGYGDRIFLSENNGEGWVDIIATNKIEMSHGGFPWIERKAMHWNGCITIDPFRSERAFLTSGNGIFMTENLAASPSRWTFAVRGLEETVPMAVVSVPDGPLVSVILDYDGFVHDDVRIPPPTSHQPGMGSCSTLTFAARQPQTFARLGAKLQLSEDMAKSWTPVPTLPFPEARGGSIAWSADGSVLLWTPGKSKQTYRTTDRGNTWNPVEGLDFEARPVADPVNPKRIYCYQRNTGELYASADAGVSFARVGSTVKGAQAAIQTVPGREGHLWIAAYNSGLQHSTDGGKTFHTIAPVKLCRAVGIGKAAAGANYDTLFIWGNVEGGVEGIYRSTDLGLTWLRINNDAKEFGGLANGQFIVGDANIFGRVYMSTAGRGIVFGEPKESE